MNVQLPCNKIVIENNMLSNICPDDKQEIYQRITIREDGKVYFSSRLWDNYNECSYKGIPGRRIQCCIDPDDARGLIRALADYLYRFAQSEYKYIIADVYTWTATVTNQDDSFTVYGADGDDYMLMGVSLLIRSLLPFSGAALFSIPEKKEENKEPYPGDIVYHEYYGRGIVKGYSESRKYIRIRFDDNAEPIPFPYPDAFENGILRSYMT